MSLTTFVFACSDEEAHALAQGAGALDAVPDVARAVEALLAACRARAEVVLELDAFHFDDDDLPELAMLQGGGSIHALDLPFDEDTGVPAAAHFTAADTARLRDAVCATRVDDRKPYTQAVLRELQDALVTAGARGLIVFTL